MGKSLWLISWCTLTSVGRTPSSEHTPSGSARIMAYTTIMDTVLSQVCVWTGRVGDLITFSACPLLTSLANKQPNYECGYVSPTPS
jgi:hypothetical protein